MKNTFVQRRRPYHPRRTQPQSCNCKIQILYDNFHGAERSLSFGSCLAQLRISITSYAYFVWFLFRVQSPLWGNYVPVCCCLCHLVYKPSTLNWIFPHTGSALILCWISSTLLFCTCLFRWYTSRVYQTLDPGLDFQST